MNIPHFFAIYTLSTTKEESIAEALCRGLLASFFYFFEKLTNFSKEASLPEMMPPSKFSFVVVFLVSSCLRHFKMVTRQA